MLTGLIMLLIVIAVLVGLAVGVDKIGVTGQLNTVIKVILALVGVLYVIHFFGIY